MQDWHAELQRFTRDTEYYEAHQADLLQGHPESWVAIFNERVVGAAPDARQLLAELARQGIPIGEALVEYVTAKDDVFILPS